MVTAQLAEYRRTAKPSATMTSQPTEAADDWDLATQREAAVCTVQRMLGKCRSRAYIRKTLRNRFGIEDEQEILGIYQTVFGRWRAENDDMREHRRDAAREGLATLMREFSSKKSGLEPFQRGKLLLETWDRLAKLDALFLSDHLRAEAQAMAIAGTLTDEQLDKLIDEAVTKRIESMPLGELEAAMAKRRAV